MHRIEIAEAQLQEQEAQGSGAVKQAYWGRDWVAKPKKLNK
jgi:hypothetical protein